MLVNKVFPKTRTNIMYFSTCTTYTLYESPEGVLEPSYKLVLSCFPLELW